MTPVRLTYSQSGIVHLAIFVALHLHAESSDQRKQRKRHDNEGKANMRN